MKKLHALMAGIAAVVVLSACAGVGVPGFGENSGCRTVYVFKPSTGGVQPISNCGDSLPRDTMMAPARCPIPQLATSVTRVQTRRGAHDGQFAKSLT